MRTNKIIILGSSNTDMVIKSDRLPVPGETILGGTFMMNPGGKGANQAVAAARLGANVTFISKVGNDLLLSYLWVLWGRLTAPCNYSTSIILSILPYIMARKLVLSTALYSWYEPYCFTI